MFNENIKKQFKSRNPKYILLLLFDKVLGILSIEISHLYIRIKLVYNDFDVR